MVNRERKQQRGDEKKELIAKEALKLFKEKGYKKVTVDEIVKVCNTSKGSFYHHYNSKTDILNEHFAIADKYYEKMYATLPTDVSAKERMQLFLHNMYIYLEKTFSHEFLAIIYSTSLESETHLYFRNPKRKLFILLEELLAAILKENPGSSDLTLHELKQALTQVVMGTIYFWCTLLNDLSLHESAKGPINHFLNGFH
ncbi:TetR/AcrR family transcriptional regulator [Solibacillus sp. FSL H8-0538]|uniref:TetR/AcrR family transcriptional regulator n=1 Tax=Solibacillus sp. FSL H8-0538 TaxID=2921400 RepID=UPI0030F5643C